MLMYDTKAIFLKSNAPRKAGGMVLSNVRAFPMVRISCTNMVIASKLPVLASAHNSGVRPKSLSCFGKTVKSIFPKISVVSNCLNQSEPTLFFSSSSRILLYFMGVFLRWVLKIYFFVNLFFC